LLLPTLQLSRCTLEEQKPPFQTAAKHNQLWRLCNYGLSVGWLAS